MDQAVSLQQIVCDFAEGLHQVDASGPVAVSARTRRPYQAGIGPHAEPQTVAFVLEQLARTSPERYGQYGLGVAYADGSGQRCDLCLGSRPAWSWAIEVKMFRLMGDNGKPNDSILMHVLSPYAAHRSSLTDCQKLLSSGLGDHKAVVIYGYDYPDWPMDPVVDAFEVLASRRVSLGPRHVGRFQGLVHPVHERGRVLGWEVREKEDQARRSPQQDLNA